MLRAKARRVAAQRCPQQGRGCANLAGQSLRRGYMQIGQAEAFEDSFVLWLQAGNWFADIRSTLDGLVYSGFGGVVEWQRPTLYFRHLINIGGELSESDVGDIVLTDFGCLERGEFIEGEQVIGFEEKWLMQRIANRVRVFVKYVQGVLTGLEVQLDRSCILIEKRSVACYTRFGAGLTDWRCQYASSDAQSLRWLMRRRPTGASCRPGWSLKETQ
ncbi:MAG: hypothetical protein ACI9BC_002016 [Crocinitomicaceae bacterium]|jgi:hypothetical protein